MTPKTCTKTMDSLNNICAVVVTYNIGSIYKRNFNTLHDQVDRIIIIDNGSDQNTIKTLLEIKNKFANKVELILNETNIGLAKAQNVGILKALSYGHSWVLLLDHDSFLKSDMIDKMKHVYEKLTDKEQSLVSIIAPTIHDTNIHQPLSFIVKKSKFIFARKDCGQNEYITEVLSVIASGSLIKVSAINKVGLVKEDFFIDYIDTEYCLRLISAGYKIYAVKEAILYHTLGERKLYRIGQFKISPTFHSPDRRFFIYRNRVRVWKHYITTEPSYVVYDIMAAIYDILRILILETSKFRKITKAIKGFTYGIFTPFNEKQ